MDASILPPVDPRVPEQMCDGGVFNGQNIAQPSRQGSLTHKPDFRTQSGWSPCREQRCHHDSLKATGGKMWDMAGLEWSCVFITAVMKFRGNTLEMLFGPERT